MSEAKKGEGAALGQLADQAADRSDDGHYANTLGSALAVMCTSMWKGPRDQSAVDASIATAAKASPILGGQTANEISACANWPAPIVSTPHPIKAKGAAPILLLHNRGDGAAPMAWAKQVETTLANAVLVTNEGQGHGAIGETNPCLNKTIQAYLTEGTLPPKGTTCKAQ